MTVTSFQEPLTLGVDLGGTKIEISLVDASGMIITSHRRATRPERSPDAIIADLIEGITNCRNSSPGPVQALGVGMAGQIARDEGVVHFSPNLDWRDVPLKSRLTQALGLPVVISNDVRAATYGEWRYGAGRDVADLVCLFVGTGIGGGIVSGGRLIDGGMNTAGELGHLTIVKNGRQCRCRNQGCLEAYAGGWAIAERSQEAVTGDPVAGQALIDLAGKIDQISAAHVSRAYISGDPLAHNLVVETAGFLAAGMVGIINALNPSLLVLGGGVIQGLPVYIDIAEKIVRQSALEAALENLIIVTAGLGDKAGVVGAAALARNSLQTPH